MKREKELVKNIIILSLGRFVPQLFSVITLPIITGKLTAIEYGTYDLILTAVSFALPIVTLQIQSAAFRFLIDCRDDENEKEKIITCILYFTVPIAVLMSVIFFFVSYRLGMAVRIGVCLYFMADILNTTLGQIARGLSYNREYAKSAMILSFANMCLIVMSLQMANMGLLGVVLAVGISGGISCVYLMCKCKMLKYFAHTSFSCGMLKKMLVYSWPMIPNNMSNWVLQISDRLVITYFLGIEMNAVYAIANKIPSFLNGAKSILVMAWQENASIAAKDDDKAEYYSKMFDIAYSLTIGITVLLIACNPFFFSILIKGDYAMAYYQMPILFIGVFFGCMSSFQGGIYIALMKTKSVGNTTMLAAAINLCTDLLLVRYIGIYAGSVSTLISFLFLFLYRMFDVRRYQKIFYHYAKIVKQTAVLIVVAIVSYQNIFWGNIMNVCAGVIYFVFVNKDILKSVVSKMFRNGTVT